VDVHDDDVHDDDADDAPMTWGDHMVAIYI